MFVMCKIWVGRPLQPQNVLKEMNNPETMIDDSALSRPVLPYRGRLGNCPAPILPGRPGSKA
jgi:hypothetical protein